MTIQVAKALLDVGEYRPVKDDEFGWHSQATDFVTLSEAQVNEIADSNVSMLKRIIGLLKSRSLKKQDFIALLEELNERRRVSENREHAIQILQQLIADEQAFYADLAAEAGGRVDCRA